MRSRKRGLLIYNLFLFIGDSCSLNNLKSQSYETSDCLIIELNSRFHH